MANWLELGWIVTFFYTIIITQLVLQTSVEDVSLLVGDLIGDGIFRRRFRLPAYIRDLSRSSPLR